MGGTKARDVPANLRRRENREVFTEWLCCWTCPKCSLRTLGSYHPATSDAANLDKKQQNWPVLALEQGEGVHQQAREGRSCEMKGMKKTWLWSFLLPLLCQCLHGLLDTHGKVVSTRVLYFIPRRAWGYRGLAGATESSKIS